MYKKMLSHTREPVFVIFLHSLTSETISRGKKSTFFLPLGPSPWAEKKLISPLGDGFGGRTVQKKIPKTGSLGTKYLFRSSGFLLLLNNKVLFQVL